MTREVLVSARVSHNSGAVEGSVTTPCYECREDVWVAPSSTRMPNFLDMLVVCTECAIKMGMSLENMAPPTPEQLSEIKLSYPDEEWPAIEAFLMERGWLT